MGHKVPCISRIIAHLLACSFFREVPLIVVEATGGNFCIDLGEFLDGSAMFL
jgi:hypothetical protein